MRDPLVIGRRPPAARRFLSARELGQQVSESPLAWIIAGQVTLHLLGIGWGLPASDGWDNDGVAPRDFLAGIVATFTPGQYFRYPPVHLALLTALSAPVVAVALGRAHSLGAVDVVAEVIRVPYMTTFALLGRAVTIAMAAGLVWALAKTAEEIRGRTAGLWTAAFAGVGVPLVYYGQTSNLDVPYLFWGSLAVLGAVRAIIRREPRMVTRSAVFAALSVGTKDQAFALFVLAVPVGLLLCAALDPSTWGLRSPARRWVGRGVAWGFALLGVVDGPLYNPRGFVRRLAFLAGPASAPFAPYSDDVLGRLAVLWDVGARFVSVYPLAFAVPVVVGLATVCRNARRGGSRFAAGLVPLLVAVSFTLAFNCVARRADHRFVLPQAAMASIYGGVGIDELLRLARAGVARSIAWAALLGAFAYAAWNAADVEVNLAWDPRYDAEGWMNEHMAPRDRVETYGLNAYLPRFPADVVVDRVGPEPLAGRSPLPGVEEVQSLLGDVPRRAPRFLVVPEAWAGRYLVDAGGSPGGGRVLAQEQVASLTDRDARAFFRALADAPSTEGYRLVHTARWCHRAWPPLDIHASTARAVAIYERLGE
jgi:hypothetical protein